jgi:hypothetical protein
MRISCAAPAGSGSGAAAACVADAKPASPKGDVE